ncbi:MAG: PDZ domain-containing protein [Rhodospirillales bacterium]
MTHALSILSEAIASLAAGSARWLSAIRVGSYQHVTGILWSDHWVVASDDGLPALDSFALAMSDSRLATARLLHRDPALNLALLRLDQAHAVPAMTTAHPPPVGSLAIAIGADADAKPTVRLTAIHRHAHAGEYAAVLDLQEAQAASGSLVLDATGAVLGTVQIAPGGVVAVMPHRTIGRFIETAPHTGSAQPNRPQGPARRASSGGNERRGWFGLALQPITVPEPLVTRAGQASGRLVVGITVGGPAEQAGLRVGDVVLSLDGYNTNSPNALRTFLEASAIGQEVEVRILRDGNVAIARLIVAEQP